MASRQAAGDPAVAPPSAAAPAPSLLQVGHLFAPWAVVDPQLSPDGERIAWRVPAAPSEVLLRPVDSPGDDLRLPASGEPGRVKTFLWGGEDRIAVLRRVEERWRVELVELGGEGGAVAARAIFESVAVELSLVAMVPDAPARLFVAARHSTSGESTLLSIDVASGEVTEVGRVDGEVERWLVDAAGHPRAVELRGLDGAWTLARLVDGRPGARLASCSSEETCRVLALDPGGHRVWLASDHGGAPHVGLAVLDLATGRLRRGPEPTVRAGGELGADLAGASFSSEGVLLATWTAGFPSELEPRDADFAADWQRLSASLPDGSEAELVSSSDDGRRHLLVADAALFLLDRRRGEMRELMRMRAEDGPRGRPIRRSVRYAARDGVVIAADLTLPTGFPGVTEGQSPVRTPAILLPPDDPWRPRQRGPQPLVELLVDRGYVVLQPVPRGSVGFGRAFRVAGERQWGGAMLDDLADGVGWLVAEGFADAERVAIVGFGWGGYAAVAALAFTPDLYAAAVSVDGPLDLATLVESDDDPLSRAILRRRIGDPDHFEQRQRLVRHSPLAHAGAIRAPLLRVDLEAGEWSDPGGSARLAALLRQLGRPIETLSVSGSGGRLEGPAGATVAVTIEAFLARHLGGRPEAPQVAAGESIEEEAGPWAPAPTDVAPTVSGAGP